MTKNSKTSQPQASPSKPPLVKWGDKPVLVRAEVAAALNSLPEGYRRLLERSVTQGYGFAKASKGTHSGGWCVDFSIKRAGWSRDIARYVGAELERVGFAVAFRYAGEFGSVAHVHIAFKGKANYSLIKAAQAGGKTLAKQIDRAFDSLTA